MMHSFCFDNDENAVITKINVAITKSDVAISLNDVFVRKIDFKMNVKLLEPLCVKLRN